ncbi:MAG: hypothetical protein KGH94_02400, partial [Candidatus Micrarchaeota archaeon]|nr:hypothetical protein [Candidatus Micrarchaeota archaeon]
MIDISPIVGGIIALVIGVVTTIFILIIRDRVCRCEKELKSVVKTELLKCFDRYIKADKEFKKEKIFSGIIILKA